MITRNLMSMMLACGALGGVAATPAAAGEKVFYTASTAQMSLTSEAGAQTTILTLYLPQGNWLVHANADVINFGPADYERCYIANATVLVDGSTATTTPTDPVVDLKAQAVVAMANAGQVMLACSHDNQESGEYVDPNASLIAEKIGTPVQQ